MDILIVAAASVQASLVARRLLDWGARTCVVPDETVAAALIPERVWSAIIVDQGLGRITCEALARTAAAIPRRIVLLKPAMRSELEAMKAAGFTDYLVKPVRAASLAERLSIDDLGFDHAEEDLEDREAVLPAPPAGAGCPILIAEDNEINALLARSLLTRLGHRPTVASTGTEAVEAWTAACAAGEPYQLVLMDVHMPGSDGIEATRRIRAAENEGRGPRTPIIALTANAFDEDREACLAAGMDGFLIKPLDRERLQGILQSAIAAPLAA
jgi:CheY-like chemotaxis protein